MNKKVLQQVIQKLETLKLEYGSINIEFTYHNGNITYYIINQSERHNVEVKK